MPLRRKKQETDPTTKRLMEQGIIKVKSDEDSKNYGAKEKLKEFGKVTYDFWSGVKYTLILSALLWWLPLFGPMLAGYVGGRRTGGPKKGITAAVLALGAIAGVQLAFTYNLMPENVLAVLEMPSSILAVAYQRPMLTPYVRFLELYWGSFFTSVLGGLPYSPNSYLITIIFAYVGGVISVEKKRELESAKSSGSTINIDLSRVTELPTSGKKSTDKKKMLVDSNFNYHPRSAKQSNNPKRWEDLKPIHYNPNKQKKGQSKKRSKKKKADTEQRYKPVKFSKRPVRHHTNTEGDDWEFL
ncbi:MAG: hypothetical protein ACOCT7_00445 [Candidatus Saliniplasma sp.]